MNTITVRDFRANLSAYFDRVDAGERILIRRRSKLYTIVPVEDDDLMILPKLQARIEGAESTTVTAIEEARRQQKAYSEDTLEMKPIDLSSVDNMLKG